MWSSAVSTASRRLLCIFSTAVTVVLASPRLQAQTIPVQVSGRFGLAFVPARYHASCLNPYLAYSLEVQGRKRVFPQLSAEYFGGNGGRRDVCVLLDPSIGTTTGGLQLEHSGRIGLGLGIRSPHLKFFQAEGVLRAGIASGRQGYRQAGTTSARNTLPHAGGQITAIVFRSVVLSTSLHWSRLTYDTKLVGSAAVESRSSWLPIVTSQIGLRLPARP
jgi:hypothetical protein